MHNVFFGLYEKAMPNELTLPEKLLAAKNAGFNYMELSVDESEEKLARLCWSKKERLLLIEAIQESGVPILTLCLSGHRRFPLGSESEEVRQRGLEILAQAIDLAVDIGVRIIQLAGYDEYYRPSTQKTRALFAQGLCAGVAMAAKKGVVLAFETMETPFMDTAGKAMEFVRTIDSPYLQVFPDTGNLTNAALLYGTDPIDDLRMAKGHLAALHLKESKPGIYREVPFGTGHVDFSGLIRAAGALGVSLYTVECWHTGQDDWREQLAQTRRFFDGIAQSIQ